MVLRCWKRPVRRKNRFWRSNRPACIQVHEAAGAGDPCTERGVMAGHSGFHRRSVHDVAHNVAEQGVGAAQACWVAQERRDGAASLQRLLYELLSGCARGANDQEFQSALPASARGRQSSRRLSKKADL